MNAWKFLMSLNESCHFQTREGKKCGSVSNSELKRWIQNRVFVVNNLTMKPDTDIVFPVSQCSLFKKENKITLI